MSDDKSKTARRLESTGEETPDLRAVVGSDEDVGEMDVYGYQVIYTTGEFTVSRGALLDKMRDVGLPEWMYPSPVAPHRAFPRMVSELREEGEIEFSGERVKLKLDSGESRFTQHVHAKVYHSPEDTAEEEGKWIDWELGVIRYDSDFADIEFLDRIDDDHSISSLWEAVKERAQDRFEEHQEMHNGKDINNLTYYLTTTWTDSVRLRDSCYFIPANYAKIEHFIDAFRELYAWIDREHKESGERTELHAVEIVDTERQRDMVEKKVRDNVEDELEGVFDEVITEVKQGENVDEIAEEVTEELERIGGIADDHSTVLKTELSVKRAVKDVLSSMDGGREDVVDEVLEEAGFGGDE